MRSLLLVLAGLALALPPRPGGAELADMYAEVRRALTELVRAAAPASEPTRLAATTLQAPGIGTEARRTRQPARSLGAPSFSRVVITPKGTSTFEGDGAPGSRVTISIGGRVIGTQAVGPLGRWRISLERPLPAGDHHIESSARFETGTQVLVGDEVRVAIPPSFTGSAIVAYDAARDGPAQRATDREGAATSSPAPARSAEQAAVRRRAEELADRASRGFDEIQRKAMQSDGVSEGREVAARLPSGTESDAVHGSWTDAVLDWLHRANRDYQREIAGKLARAPHGSKPATPGDARPAGVPTVAAEHGSDAAEQARTAARERLFAEEEARRKAERDALLARGGSRQTQPAPGAIVRHDRVSPPPPDATRPSEPRTGGEESVVSEAELAAERAASEELAQRIERRRQAAEAARLRAEARARESATTDEAERRRQELEAQRRLAEERKAAEAKRLADEAERRRQEEEAQRKLAEERKTIEARGLMAEEARRREAALRKQAEERMAANGEKQPRVPARVEPVDAPRSAVAERRAAGERTSPAGGAAGNVEVLREPAPGRAGGKDGVRRPDSRIAEGSAEKGPVDGAVPSGRRTTARVDSRRRQGPEPTTCRGRKAGRRVDLPGVYIVRRGDTLWAIARRHYGSGARYPLIYRANRRTIADPDLIYPCQRIHLPRRGRRG